jgi:hypothetical protein
MRLPRVRFTMRRMMVAVAILAVLLWGGLVEIPRLRGLARDYRDFSLNTTAISRDPAWL